MLQKLQTVNSSFDLAKPPANISFKALAHIAARMDAGQRAGLAGQLVKAEVVGTHPTRGLATYVTGASGSSLAKALRATPQERAGLVSRWITLHDLNPTDLEHVVKDCIAESLATLNAPTMPMSAWHPVSIDGLLSAYRQLSASERVTFGRAIGVERVWQPKPRTRVRA